MTFKQQGCVVTSLMRTRSWPGPFTRKPSRGDALTNLRAICFVRFYEITILNIEKFYLSRRNIHHHVRPSSNESFARPADGNSEGW